jgi:hypothetical protein
MNENGNIITKIIEKAYKIKQAAQNAEDQEKNKFIFVKKI